MIEPGAEAPDFTLPNQDGDKVSLGDFAGRKLVLAFYPLDFSPVCTDQLSLYQEVLGEIEGKGADPGRDQRRLHLLPRGVSRSTSNLTMPLLADFHPKGEVVARLRRLDRRGRTTSNRSLVLVGEDGVVALVLRSAEHRSRSPAPT